MSEREALAAALGSFGIWADFSLRAEFLTVRAAARERLTQLPEKCGVCSGTGSIVDVTSAHIHSTCPTCHGSGKVYPAELVEQIARLFARHGDGTPNSKAVAVLDALNERP